MGKKNILMLTPQLPFPAHQGTTLRNYHIIRGLAGDNQIDLLSYGERPDELAVPDRLAEICDIIEIVKAPSARSTNQRLWQMVSTTQPDMALRLKSDRFAEALETLLQRRVYDVVQIEGIELAWTIPIIRRLASRASIVFDAHNAETLLQIRSGEADHGSIRRWPAAAYSRLQSSRLARYEAWACREVDHVVAVSENDHEALLALSGIGPGSISVIPNSIDVASYHPSEMPHDTHRFDVVFSGKMDYRPNIDAVLWFADNVWPRLKEELPQATWAIVGQKPHARIEHLGSLPDVTLTGWVPDVKPYLTGAQIFVMPFRVGSGTRLKLIEALAAERAVVSTRVGVEGFPVIDGEHLVIADTAEQFAAETVSLLRNAERRAYLGRQGKLFAEKYDWRVVVPDFQTVYDGLAL